MSGLHQRSRTALVAVKVMPESIRLIGGFDELTPPYQRRPGTCRAAQNYEAVSEGGYRRIAGYERLDGRTKPSNAVYSILPLNITGTITVGNTVTGATSGATGVVVAIVSAPPAYLVITRVTGTWQSGENILVSAVVQGQTTAAATPNGASTPLLHVTYRNLAADNYRADIAAVPGSGRILGVFEYNDIQFAFRNNAGGTAAVLYKSTTGGWSLVPYAEEVSFSNANTSVGEGDTLTQGAVTATIARLVLETGTLASSVNTGRLIITGRAGGNFAAGAATSTGGGALTLSGAQSAIAMLPSGTFDFFLENFTGSTGTRRIYGADTVNRGFEFDGTNLVPINTGMTTDKPTKVYGHQNQLFFAFAGGSAQHSAPGQPYVWSPVLGASEIALGDDITGFDAQPGNEGSGALAIFTRNRTAILYGTGVSNWNLKTYRRELGAYHRTMQNIGLSVFLDDRGVTNLQTTNAFGNFAHATMSDVVRNSINAARLLATTSCISRDRNQYRLFLSSGAAYYFTIAYGKLIGIMPMLFPHVVRCCWSGERSDGSEAIYFGTDDGFVMQMEKGTSFDGANIEAFIVFSYAFQGTPRINKRYRDVTVEMSGNSYVSFSLGFTLGYGLIEIPQAADIAVTNNFSPAFWDAFTWDAFTWDGVTLSPSSVGVDGEAENISYSLRSNTDISEAFTVTWILHNYSVRGRLRAA